MTETAADIAAAPVHRPTPNPLPGFGLGLGLGMAWLGADSLRVLALPPAFIWFCSVREKLSDVAPMPWCMSQPP